LIFHFLSAVYKKFNFNILSGFEDLFDGFFIRRRMDLKIASGCRLCFWGHTHHSKKRTIELPRASARGSMRAPLITGLLSPISFTPVGENPP
jgi:hypothetical protein